MNSYIASYCHNIAANNAGGSLLRLSAQSDFAFRTDEFINFAKILAMKLFVIGESGDLDNPLEQLRWSRLVELAPDLEDDRIALMKEIGKGEKVTLEYLCIFRANGEVICGQVS